ncbi:GntR family transcriptional regulator [Chengkuizengella axinellae]|uniref:GntR family transcriptional regulator n=1 Tax=Chengkuizengella axinellae TaxID=3064388 RepID=A0ABT9IZ83_9BACL|nr:GntR family transcriptional regulator [Chengkuizengella sp. 2205SS18-9]MDP5274672.1 GntR family transcriptional regulator [Chengkuizengella sp. 2205SS18-9]
MINKNSPLPIYYQLAELIKLNIDNGDMQAGEAIPSERQFAEQYDISRMTVRQAINNLVNEGYLYRHKGKGTFVSNKKLEHKFVGKLTSFTEDMKKEGYEPSSRWIQFEIIPAFDEVAGFLKIEENDPVYEIKRVRLADQDPVAIETVYMSAQLIPNLTQEQMEQQSLYQYIEKQYNYKIQDGIQTIESTIASEFESVYLKISKGAPMLLMQQQTFLEDKTPLEFVISAYRADRYKFTIEIKREF